MHCGGSTPRWRATAVNERVGRMAAGLADTTATAAARTKTHKQATDARPSPAQLSYLRGGLAQAGGKLPLFDAQGRQINRQTIRSCIERGWAEPWFANPIKPDWLVCKLTAAGREAIAAGKPSP